MKKLLFISLITTFSLTSCTYWQGNPAAIQAGASIGGVVGAIIGDNAGGYSGSQFGALIGTVTGAAVGNAITTPKNDRDSYEDGDYYVQNNSSSRYLPSQRESEPNAIVISNIRFVDENRNHIINAAENGKVIFDVTNDSPVALYNVTPVISVSGVKNLYVSPSQVISYMEPGSTIRYAAYILSGKRIKNGMADFNIYAVDSNGGVSDYHRFSLPIQKRVK